MIKIKRIYEEPIETDGFRILVDRLWPRGIKKDRAKIDLWLKEIAPSDKLRKRFSHKDEKWEEFEIKYKEDLRNKKELIEKIKGLEKKYKTLTFLFSAKNIKHNNAVVLLEFMENN